ncbi:MAG: bifunctional tRNA (5-methylaminomethyl-2-thiouridine)(34)-methyltransferase MnmD/FAD-dependent 5-carboxymethylaminomethyl-2-thiouridine(34) oxidoreductase MnmC [Rhodocyclaceae bacterium]|nr:bifunctional tRNA (5-methylaminomethyl-2-thiouridine)(34)-methyltransferase MnmD/FAD-dependent 5-carboxymethylaminomethyl-2-thiouridine(34) oxidoreductase MnmC [Rhodocyclaceae bacterium]MBK9310946.1 bifunctional tRNA (5-methylaminomethyl-2-thiouridine)(34)-methyltransferase MnmD/FAD-dependent 5-carboxymethylaminomethyl-2-thiouridine(34) oxidoreductase MnmC [Rhodocyclaceae bacterium]
MTYQTIVPAELAYAGATPYSARYDDIYHSAQGGLEQARHVFLGGNDIPAAWRGCERFVILETGLGLGLNFLATWHAWRNDPQRCRRLHFLSVEKHPFRRDDLARLHEQCPELAGLSAQLVLQWPTLVPGLHRLHFENEAVTLTLVFGNAVDWLPQLTLAADAFYLDGFAPDRNPDLWSDATFAQLRRLAAPGATLATWTVAEDVTRRAAAADFRWGKRPGFGNKRYMLAASAPGTRHGTMPTDRRIVVVGAGLAGASAANRLAARDYDVTVLERASKPAQGASGNIAGIFRPLPSLDDTRLSRLLRACFLYGQRHFAALPGVRHGPTGVLHLARDARHEDTQRRTAEAQFAPELFRFVERDEAARLAGWPVEMGGWWFPGGGWIDPPSLCRTNLAGRPVRCGVEVARMERKGTLWRLFDSDRQLIAEAPQLVLANGIDTPRLAPQVPIRVGRGLVSHLPEADVPRFDIVATRNGYVTPAIDGLHCAGATLTPDDMDTAQRLDDHVENLLRLDAILPGYGKSLNPAQLDGRVGLRPMSPDRLPIVGPVSASDGLWIINGFGARGLVWASLCAELLASRIAAEPLPIEAELVQAIGVSRFDDKRRSRRTM